ncbi:hypothetical protein, partial [Dactylosporangium matsuzakiense]|uniref:hypothetical protein n=1 Tax=Dactylosporangium matsuzakiense TaxID=53360 RepID=UPI0022F2C1DF
NDEGQNESIGDRECVALNATTHAIIANLAARKQLRHNRVARLDGHSDTVGSEWRRVDVALFRRDPAGPHHVGPVAVRHGLFEHP